MPPAQLQAQERQQNGAGELFEKFQRQRQTNGDIGRVPPMDKRTNELAAQRPTPPSSQTNNNGTTSGGTVRTTTTSENVSTNLCHLFHLINSITLLF